MLRLDENTFIIRQSKTVSFEAPFRYLLLGNERALRVDTGAVADPERCPLRQSVDQLLASWLSDLGGRVLEIMGIPGHHAASVAVFDAYQPQEPSLRMSVDQLRAVRDAAVDVAHSRGAHVFDDFVIFNGPCHTAVARQLARSAWTRLRNRF